jgi:acylphosphatase
LPYCFINQQPTTNKIMATQWRLSATVRGRVQGVGFRAAAYDKARSLGLTGWVRN